MRNIAHSLAERLSVALLDAADRLANKGFYHYPLGKSPRCTADTYLAIWEKARENRYDAVEQYVAASGHCIDEGWFQQLALLTQVVEKNSDICYEHGRLLYSALSAYATENPVSCVNIIETGTARGFSTLCMAKALLDLDQPGKIVTIDVLPHDVPMYWNCISDGQGARSRCELLSDYKEILERYVVFLQGDSKMQLHKLKMPRVHFAFLDGAHTYSYVMREFGNIRNSQQKGDVIFFDDYTPQMFPGVVKAVDEICQSHGYARETIAASDQRGYVIARKID